MKRSLAPGPGHAEKDTGKIRCSVGTDVRAVTVDGRTCHSYGNAVQRIPTVAYAWRGNGSSASSLCCSPEGGFRTPR